MPETYEFDDVLIKPKLSLLSSRDDVDISFRFSNSFILKFPLIASPMVGVTDGNFIKQLSDLGGLGIFHRFYKTESIRYNDIIHNVHPLADNYGIALKIEDSFTDVAISLSPKIILIDTANGYTKNLADYCSHVKTKINRSKNKNILLMAGNVATKEGCDKLYHAGVDIIRVGIGGGSPCSTRNQTGIGIPNISAIMDCAVGKEGKYFIAIDGGIKNSGDFVKSIVAGADIGISGKLYAECYEAPNEGVLYGMASRTHMENMKKRIKSVEGFDTYIEKKHSLAQFVKEFGYGIKSAGTYLNAKTLNEIRQNGVFVKVTNSAIKKNI